MSLIFHQDHTNMSDVLRQSAKKQLDSYADAWIIMFEGLQNALDAVEDNPGDKRVRISINPNKNEVQISDNGKGFPPDKLNFALGKGTKGDLNNPNIRGEHGVGIKMVILCTNKFVLWTKTLSNKIFKAEFTDHYKFLEGAEMEEIDENANYSEIPEGYTTSIKYQFPKSENAPRPINLRAFLNEMLGKYRDVVPHKALSNKNLFNVFIEHYFRTNSYTGDVNRLFDDVKPATIEVIIPKDDSIADDELSKFYPAPLVEHWVSPKTISFPAKYWDPTEWFADPSRKGFRMISQLKVFNPSIKTPDQIWVLKLKAVEDIKLLLNNPHLKQKFTEDYFDTFISRKLRGIFLIIGPASQAKYNIREVMLGEPDQIIAADGVLTTNQIRAPKRGKNQNYLNNINFVINVADRVNYGKQGVKNPSLLSMLYSFFEEVYVNKLVELATSVAGKNPSVPTPEPSISLITLKRILDPQISIKRVPIIENTLIALTHELIALGRITGIETFQLHSTDQYDCKGIITFNNRTFNPTRNEDLHSYEYKVYLTALIDDFENGYKSLKDLQLIIVWENDLKSSQAKYQLLDLENSSYEHLSVSGVEVVLRNIESGDEAPVLVIKDLVEVEVA